MASPGWNRPRPVLRENGGGADPHSITGQHLGNGKVSIPIPFHSKIVREGMRQYSSSTGMQVSACQPIMPAAQGMAHHYPDMGLGEAKSLNN